jgi:dCTP diphosphatase
MSDVREIQAAMDAFVRSRGWYGADSPKPQKPRNLAASISLEAAEVLEHFQWGDAVEPGEIADELADLVLYAAQLANVLGVDLAEAIGGKLVRNEARWPTRVS